MIFGIIEGFKNFIRSKFTGFISVLSMMFALTLISLIMIVFYNTRINLRIFENKTTIQVYFSSASSTKENIALSEKIKDMSIVSNINFVSKVDGLKEFLAAQSITEKDVQNILKSNPLPDMMDIELSSSNLTTEKILNFKEELLKLDKSLDVKVELSFFEDVKLIAKKIFQVLIGLTLFVIIITVILIFNTIRLSIHGRKLSIMTMKLVGAKNFLIRIPFIFESIYQSIIACIVVSLGSYYAIQFLNENFDFIKYLYRPLILYRYHFYILAFISLSIASIGSFLSVRKYLKLSFKT